MHPEAFDAIRRKDQLKNLHTGEKVVAVRFVPTWVVRHPDGREEQIQKHKDWDWYFPCFEPGYVPPPPEPDPPYHLYTAT